mmetsp:Transcript_97609/g.172879  ORF Transcript_97609/g.172879 Transcript_97609/m.172879 type:complete len:108 (+) Transcript_97609:114-437(+)
MARSVKKMYQPPALLDTAATAAAERQQHQRGGQHNTAKGEQGGQRPAGEAQQQKHQRRQPAKYCYAYARLVICTMTDGSAIPSFSNGFQENNPRARPQTRTEGEESP